MNQKKLLPILLLVILAVVALFIKRCNNHPTAKGTSQSTTRYNSPAANPSNNGNYDDRTKGLDRNPDKLFYTKHARCRMKCRHITQQEVKDILVNGTINYNKSELQDARGPKYAVEGNTNDGQHVRIIFAPNSQHISVVTVIDLEEDFACSCD